MSQDQVWTIQEILQWTTRYFDQHHMDSSRLDAELLLARICGCERLGLYLNADKPLSDEERTQYRELIKKRIEGVPVAYLIGKKDFWTLSFEVQEGVLIPRPDTETLVEAAYKSIKQWQRKFPEQRCSIVDLGTGTGAIPLALCSELRNLSIIGIDISEIALSFAHKNRQHYHELLDPRQNEVHLLQADRFSALSLETPFDYILSNPPYIPTQIIPTLQKEVASYEPKIALDGGTDGLDFYRYFSEKGEAYLKTGGNMFLEIGADQKNALETLTGSSPSLNFVECFLDIQNLTRVVHLQKV
ncbi:peptide chain release factor N(5)-glutamine methyltransferase [Deltaproteobacteria bacterium TL4]